MTPSVRRAGSLDRSWPLLAALLVGAFAFRPQLAVIGPLAVPIQDGLGANHAFVGLLTAIPVLCMGLFAPLAPLLGWRLGAGRGIVLVAAVIALAGVLRGVLAVQGIVLALTVVIGVATALAGPLQAMLVRAELPGHVVAGTAAYAAGTSGGAAIAAGLAVPLANVLGGWQAALIAISVLSFVGAPALLRQVHAARRPQPVARVARPRLADLPLRRPAVWGLGLLFGLQSCLYYGTSAWLPSTYVERGWDQGSAAMLVSLSNVMGVAAILLVPLAARRWISREWLLAAAAITCVAGLLGVTLLPAPGWLWAVVLGIGLGIMFTLVQTLPSDLGGDARETGGAAALMLLAGYLIAASAPFLLGAVRDATGSFSAGLWALVGIAIVMLPLARWLTPHRLGRRAAERIGSAA